MYLTQNKRFEMICGYSRAQAISDGLLRDVSWLAKEAGFTAPVAVTNTVWTDYIEWTDSDTNLQTYQDTKGRLWDVLSMLRLAIKTRLNRRSVCYKLLYIPRDGKSKQPKLILLKATIGSGDNGEPVITIMLPDED